MTKFLFFMFLFLQSSTLLIAQEKKGEALLVDGKLILDSIYSNKEELMIFSGIHKFENISQAELKTKVKNWASLNFVNLKEVLVSETDDQIVLNYITQSYYVKSLGMKTVIDWYIRLMIQFKDGKIKCTYYDDGNARIAASQYSSATASRTYHLKDYFREKDGVMVCAKANTLGMINLFDSIIASFKSIKDSIEKNEAGKSNDW